MTDEDPHIDGGTADDDATDTNGRYAELAGLLRISANGAPPRAKDPIAAMLGLVPDASCRLDSRKLRLARKSAGIGASDIAHQLGQRGWEFKTSEVVQWEIRQSAADQLAPAVVQSIAAICAVEVGKILVHQSEESRDRFDAIRQSDRFRSLVIRWASVQNISAEAASAALDSRMATTVHRGDEPDANQLLTSLEVLVTAVEQSQSK